MQRMLSRFIIIFLSSMVFVSSFASGDVPFSDAQKAALNQMISQYVRDNPKDVMNALMAYRQKEIEKKELASQQAVHKHFSELTSSSEPTHFGAKKHKVVIVEFADYQCGHCRQMASVLHHVVAQNPSVQVIVRELPIFGSTSRFAAKIAMLASREGKFEAVHQGLMAVDGKLNKANIMSVAKANGMDVAAINKALKEDDALNVALKENFRLSQALQIMGTPAFVVSDAQGKHAAFVPGAMPEAQLSALVRRTAMFAGK